MNNQKTVKRKLLGELEGCASSAKKKNKNSEIERENVMDSMDEQKNKRMNKSQNFCKKSGKKPILTKKKVAKTKGKNNNAIPLQTNGNGIGKKVNNKRKVTPIIQTREMKAKAAKSGKTRFYYSRRYQFV